MKPEKIKQNTSDATVSGDWEDDRESGNLNIEYNAEITYSYDKTKEPVKFSLGFDGNNVSFSANGNNSPGEYATSERDAMWFDYIKWSDVRVYLFSLRGDTIEFTAFRKAPQKIRDLFIRTYIENIIQSKTRRNIEEPKNNISGY
jgi:hypothetical protein